MGDLSQVVAESVANDKAKHVANGVATAAAGTAGYFDTFLGFLPHIAVFLGICVSVAIFYKTYLDIQLTKIRLAQEDRRDEGRTPRTSRPNTLRLNCKDRPKR